MHHALNNILASLPDDTKVYPGHEYTKSNARFAQSILSSHQPLSNLMFFCEDPNNQGQTQGKFTIGDEKKHNVFMMLENEAVKKATGVTEPVDVMRRLRELKNGFK